MTIAHGLEGTRPPGGTRLPSDTDGAKSLSAWRARNGWQTALLIEPLRGYAMVVRGPAGIQGEEPAQMLHARLGSHLTSL